MTGSSVTFGTSRLPRLYAGSITALQGTTIQAVVRNVSGHRLTIVAQLQLGQSSNAVAGSVTVSPGGGQ